MSLILKALKVKSYLNLDIISDCSQNAYDRFLWVVICQKSDFEK